MPWCPKCRYEYVEGISVCPECGVEMVAELGPKLDEDDDEYGPKLPGFQRMSVFDLPKKPIAHLYTTDQKRANELMALLRSSGVAVISQYAGEDYFMKYHLGGAYLHGTVGLFVAESQLEEAKVLLGLDESDIPFLYRESEEILDEETDDSLSD